MGDCTERRRSLRQAAMFHIACLAAASVLATGPAARGQADQRAAFVANNGNIDGSVTSYTINPDGSLVWVARFATGTNPQTISITPNGEFLATGHGTASSTTEELTILRVAPDATLALLEVFLVDDSPLSVQWLSDEHIAVTHTSLSTTNEVVVYRFDPAGPSLTEIDREPSGSFNTNLALHPGGEFLYAQDSSQNQVHAFRVNPDGTLDALQSISTGATFPLGMGVTADGTKLYAGGGISNGRNKVIGLSIAPNGTLQTQNGSPHTSPGASPKLAVSSGDSAYLFVGHGTDATIRVMSIDFESGDLTNTGFMFDVGFQGTLGGAAVLDDLLLVTDESTIFDERKGLYSFTIQPDGRLLQNGPIVDSQGVTPESIAVWAPAGCPGDLNGDGFTDLADLGILLADFGCTTPPGPCVGDLDGDGDTDLADLGILLADFGCGAP